MFDFLFPNHPFGGHTLRLVAQAQQGGGDVFDIARAMKGVEAGDKDAWERAWLELAEKTEARAKGLMNAAANLGIKIKDIYWTMGAFDAVFTAEAPDDETMTAFAASMGSLGNIRTQTMRAFSAQEMNQILAKLPAMDVASAK